MKALVSLAFFAILRLCVATSIVIPRHASKEEYAAVAIAAGLNLMERALPDSPSGGYAPANVSCPASRPTIRIADSLSANETAWLPIRRNATVSPMIDFLSRANISGFDASSYITNIAHNASALPNIGLTVSGGGYRALMNGAGFLAAADSRTTNATNSGQIGGLLQSATYLAGLSGGSWLVGSMYLNNFSSITTLRDGSNGSSLWQFANSIFKGPAEAGISILNTAEYFNDIYDQVQDKNDAGYDTTITDYWGRALSYQLINASDGGINYTFSSIALADNFVSGQTPLPLFVADSRAPNTQIVSLNSTLFEFNPWELGSWDPTTYAFAPLRYIGSKFNGGVIPANESCVRGFDNAGFVMGTSSTLFNQFLLQLNGTGIPSWLNSILTNILSKVGEDNDDIAQYGPNPFYHFNNGTNGNANSTELTLVDGGEDLQNIPFNPLIQPLRAVDVIFAVDSSADTDSGWPNGTSLVATYQRSLNATIQNGTSFPSIPDQNTFVNLGLNYRPTFFGCDAKNTTHLAPLIVYIPNAPYIAASNVSTFDPDYNNTQRNAIIQNGYDVATQANGTIDSQWPKCVACAVLSRSFYKTGATVPADCTACFNRYCWNGSLASQETNYTPSYKVGEVSLTQNSASGLFKTSTTTFALLAAVITLLFAL